MTPKEIVNMLYWAEFFDAKDTKERAIEAIKDYARKMCDEQRYNFQVAN